MPILYRNILLIICLLAGVQGMAQQTELVLVKNNRETIRRFTGVKLMMQYLDKEVSRLITEGYLEASYDTTRTDSLQYRATLDKGYRYTWGAIEMKGYGNAIGPKHGRILNPYAVSRIADRTITELENEGYPFAEVSLDSVNISKGEVNGMLVTRPGQYYAIDSVIIKGTVRLPRIYVQRYLGIKPGSPYNEKLVREADKRLKEIPFVTPIRNSEVLFTRSQSMLYVYLKKRNASSFNGIVGILPDSKTGKTTITGDARVILKNALGKAETFDLNWRKVANQTQDLKINVLVPFLFSSPIGTDLGLKLFKRDTSFLELNRSVGITWQLNRGNFFRVFYNRYNSDILAKTIYTTGTGVLQNADVGINQYGIGLRLERLDYRINPRKGISLSTDGSAGIKEVRPNAVNDEDLYDAEVLKTDYYTGNLQVETYIPFWKMFTLKLANQTRFIVNQKIYANELLRMGGIRTIRGFDEESIFASAFSVFTAEYRFLFEENSALFAFFDQGWYEQNGTGNYINDLPYGMGMGVNFQVKTGVFSFTWALGKQLGNPILLKNSKLHFGFINYF